MASLSRKLPKTLICKTDADDDDIDDDNHGHDNDTEPCTCTQTTYHMPKTCNCAWAGILGILLSKNADRTIQRPISEVGIPDSQILTFSHLSICVA